MDGVSHVQAYYRSIDTDDYETLTELLAGEFVHRRPDITIEGREEFVAFMRSGRPDRETTHTLEAIYAEHEGDRIAAEGTLYRSDETEWFGFVDSFEISERGIRSIRTYTDANPE